VNVLLVPAHPGFPGQIPQSRKTVVCVLSPRFGNNQNKCTQPAPSDVVPHTLPMNDIAAWIQALEAAPGLASITLDETCQAQAAEDSVQLVIQP